MEEKEELEIAQVTLTINEQPVEMEMTLPAQPVKASRVLPILQKMSDSFVKVGEEGVAAQGKEVSCKKGCNACCNHLVPVGELEARNISRLVEEMPEPKRSQIKKRFSSTLTHFRKSGWLEKLNTIQTKTNKERLEIATEFFYEGISCPLLADGVCSIYENRPLVCREFLVASPAENCSDPANKPIDRVQFPTSLSTPLRGIGNNPELGSSPPFLPLMLSLEWSEKFPESAEEKTGKAWMTDFFESLREYEKDKKEALKSVSTS
ncbi:MAG: YkgJ family cysteine cluster protein [Pyrinomonadaceae bacterium]|nr:YkgJ family cysteine cluster protein [Pyrinomonadaceae bacterium]